VDCEAKNRILQSNISCYIPWEKLPWGQEFRRRCSEQIPQLHFSSLMPHSVFEIRATPETQSRSDEYLNLAPIFSRLWPDIHDFYEPQLLAPIDFGGFLPFWRGGFWSQRQVVTYRSNRFF